MTPAEAIAMLDSSPGTWRTITLRRGPSSSPTATATVRAKVRGYGPDEISGSIAQSDSFVILSPTDLTGWPDGGRMKRQDWAIIDGRTRSIEAAENIEMDDVLVRIELSVKG